MAAARRGGAPRLGAPLPCLRREGSRRLGSGGRPSTLPPGPPPRLGPPRSRGPGPRGLGSDSFIPGGREPRTCGAPERRGKRAAANEGPRASRAPLCWAAGAGQGLREGAGACPPPPAPAPRRRGAPSLLPAWKWLRLCSSGEGTGPAQPALPPPPRLPAPSPRRGDGSQTESNVERRARRELPGVRFEEIFLPSFF